MANWFLFYAKRAETARNLIQTKARSKELGFDVDDKKLLQEWLSGKLQIPLNIVQAQYIPIANVVSAFKEDNIDYISELFPDVKNKPQETKPMPEVKQEIKAEAPADDLKALAELLKKLKGDSINAEVVRKIVQEEIVKAKGPAPVIVVRQETPEQKIEVGVQHYQFPLLLKLIDAKLNVALVGSAGTGKTHMAHAIAKALNLPYQCQSFSATTTKADLLGFIDANGNYRDTPFRRAYVNGGVWVGDEFDAGNANANVIINAATANSLCAFPDGMKEKHKDFRVILCMNTYGNGADRQYVGRNQLDAATMDRFLFLRQDIDTALESSLIGITTKSKKLNLETGGKMFVEEWLDYVVKIRAAIDASHVRHLVTPRASMFGAQLIALGLGRTWIEEMVLWKGLDNEQKQRILKEVK